MEFYDTDTGSITKIPTKGANLRGANFEGVDYSKIILTNADLKDINFKNANLRWASLNISDLRGACLEGADLGRSNLQEANLEGANLQGANLEWANLTRTNLRDANLEGSNLNNTHFDKTDLFGASLIGAKGLVHKVFYPNPRSSLLKLVKHDNRTRIYINNNQFMQCSYLLISIPCNHSNDDFESIDEIVDLYSNRNESDTTMLTPDEEFMGHCSNVQAWVENGYDTRVLDSKLSFPLLKELARNGDEFAETRLREEIILRYKSRYRNVQIFLWDEGYMSMLTREQRQELSQYTSYAIGECTKVTT